MASPKIARLLSKKQINPDSFLMKFSVEEPLDFIGGQYVILNTGAKDAEGNDIKRAYSLLSKDEDQRTFELCIKEIPGGKASPHLAQLEEGAELAFSGPWGKFLKNPLWPREGSIFIIATDTGITNALGLMNSAKLRPFLPRCHVLWFVTNTHYFMPYDAVNHRIPDELADFQTVNLSPVGDPARISESIRILEEKMTTLSTPENAYLSGDGSVLRELKTLLEGSGGVADWMNVEPFFNKLKEESAPPKGFVRSGTTGKLVATKDLREGFTTGACSAAAAKAATRALLTGITLNQIESTLPNRQKVMFKLNRCEINTDSAVCGVIKDAGDDPDATHGAELIAHARWKDSVGVSLFGGEGVATVTKAGLGLEVGGPAINPVPRKNITEMVLEELATQEDLEVGRGLEITISVPRGLEMAKKTLNERLGLIGGISILGTTGIVKPYSTAAYRASVVQSINLAKTHGLDGVILTTGGKSEQYAMDLHPDSDPMSFIQVGDFIGAGLKAAVKAGMKRAIVVGMMGKLSKMADGRTMTHAAGSDVNFAMLAEIARSLSVPQEICAEIEKAITARHVLEMCQKAGFPQISAAICERVVKALSSHAGPMIKISCMLVDFNGTLLGEYHE